MLMRFALATVLVLVAGAQEQPPASAPQSQEHVAQAPPLSPRNANYRIHARLDHPARTLTGRQVIGWRNITASAASTLQFHLYYNAWRNTASTWMRERLLAGDTALARRPAEDWGFIDITAMRLARGGTTIDLSPNLRFIAPDDGNESDRTVVEAPLPEPVRPGETVDIEIEWTSRVPRTFARTGTIGNFYFIAQWFPKIGVLEESGWNCHQFHAATEFFSDFGIYDVELDLPRGWIVGATGRSVAVREDADRAVHRFYQEDVHDFAWTTSPDYVERRARFEHPALPPVDMRLLLQPEHLGQEDRHFEATRAALRYYGEWYGPYPYGHITVVDPAFQSGAGGMEYPTLFTAGTRWLAPERATQPESVTVHEAGHQFWYGIVATNEFEHAWLDEGLNTFTQARVMAETFYPHYYTKRYFGGFVPWVFDDLPLSRDVDANRLTAFRPVASHDDPSTPTFRYWPGSASAITYNKTALWLHTLERHLGWNVLQRVMAAYFERYAFKHPKPEDFFAVANEVSGEDLTWFFDQVHGGSQTFDYAVDVFRSERPPAAGFADDDPRGAADTVRTTVVVRRHGGGIFPVDVRVTFADGQEHRWKWDGRARWHVFEIERPVRAVTAEVDPDRVLLLDLNRTNNSASLQPVSARAARKWSLAWLIWLQDHLLTYGFFV